MSAERGSNPSNALKFDAVVDFLVEKKIAAGCPQCNENETAILCDDDQDHVSVYPLHPFTVTNGQLGGINQGFAARFILLECANCGYERFFSTRAIYKWIEEKRKEKE